MASQLWRPSTFSAGKVASPLVWRRPQTTTSATTTWDSGNKSAGITLSGGDLIATGNAGNRPGVKSIAFHQDGKYYAEFTMVLVNELLIGIATAAHATTNDNAHYVGGDGAVGSHVGMGLYNSGAVFTGGGSQPTTIDGIANGNVIQLAVDLDNDLVWWATNNGGYNDDGSPGDPAAGTGGISCSNQAGVDYYVMGTCGGIGDTITANFGGSAYTYTPPTGFGNW